MSRSVGMGDITVLKDKYIIVNINRAQHPLLTSSTCYTNTGTKHRKSGNKASIPYLSGRIGSSSRFKVPWIPWHKSAGISVPWGRQTHIRRKSTHYLEPHNFTNVNSAQNPTQATLEGWKYKHIVPTEAEEENIWLTLLPQWLLYGTVPGWSRRAGGPSPEK